MNQGKYNDFKRGSRDEPATLVRLQLPGAGPRSRLRLVTEIVSLVDRLELSFAFPTRTLRVSDSAKVSPLSQSSVRGVSVPHG